MTGLPRLGSGIVTKYQPGDVVMVRNDLTPGKRYYMDNDPCTFDGATYEMCEMAGRRCTIAEISASGEYLLRDDHGRFGWVDEMFSEPQMPDDVDIDIPEDIGDLL